MFMQIGLKHTGDPEISITTMFFTRMRNLKPLRCLDVFAGCGGMDIQ
jgi:hypothetical protein